MTMTAAASTATTAGACPACDSGEHELVRGITEPRIWTPPLRELTPATSYGFELIDFAAEAGTPFDPWQEFLAIHSGELLDGRPRFRIVLVLVSRQQGKTHYGKELCAWWLVVDLPGTGEQPTILGISSKLDYAKESWEATRRLLRRPYFAGEVPRGGIRESNGEQCITTVHDTRYKIAASNDDAGRSLTISRLLVDELRRQHDWTAWSAAEPTTAAVPDAQIIALTNQGDYRSVVLRSLRKQALRFIETGEGDPRLGIFEWSAPDGSDPTDVHALAQASPNLNHPDGRNPLDALLGNAIRAKAAGGEELEKFKIESMCMAVEVLDPAFDFERWRACLDVGDLADLRAGVAACVDLSLDEQHATLLAAAVMPDGRVRLEAVRAWEGRGCTLALLRDLPGELRKVRPRVFGWFPAGPAAAVAAKLADRTKPNQRAASAWPPKGVVVAEITSEVPAVCMGFAEQVHTKQIAHSDDPLLNAQILGTQMLHQGVRWVYTRRGAGHCDATYAAAGAVHLARTLPPPEKPLPRPMVV